MSNYGFNYGGYAMYSPPSAQYGKTEELFVEVCMVIWALAIARGARTASHPWDIILSLWVIGMLACIPLSAWLGARRDEETTVCREMIYFFRRGMVGLRIVAWPITLLTSGFGSSERDAYTDQLWNEFRAKHYMAKPDTISEMANDRTAEIDLNCDAIERTTIQIVNVAGGMSETACRTTVIAATLTGVAGSAATAYAQDVTVNTKFASAYMVKNGNILHDGPVNQTEVTVSFPNGLFLDFWGSTGFDGLPNFGREIDWTAGWATKHVTAAVSYYDFSPLFATRGFGDLVSPSLEVRTSKKIGERHSITPLIHFDAFITTKDPVGNSGAFLWGAIQHNWSLSKRWSVAETGRLLFDTGVYHGSRGLVGNYEAALVMKLTKHVTATPIAVRFSIPSMGIHDRQFHTILSGGVTANWH